jgi:2,3-dihydroxy-2,3-dihydrophenylpropionate dehydrogenase
VELAPKVRVNGVAPGGVPTDLRGLAALGQSEQSHWGTPGIDWEERLRASSPLQRVMQPQDLAAAYVLLASRENACAMTGVILQVDAGSSLRMPRRS